MDNTLKVDKTVSRNSEMQIREIRYINLKKNIIRRVLIEYILRQTGYSIKRIPGVMWEKEGGQYRHLIQKGLDDYVKKETAQRKKGVLGCWVAHTNAISDIEYNDGLIVVLEDDFVCKRGFFECALSMINGFDHDFDILLFDPLGVGPKRDHFVKPGIFDARKQSFPYYYASHCLFVNARSIGKILRATESFKVRDYDGFILYCGEIRSYVFYTGKSVPIAFGSDLTGRRGLRTLLNGLKSWLYFRMTK